MECTCTPILAALTYADTFCTKRIDKTWGRRGRIIISRPGTCPVSGSCAPGVPDFFLNEFSNIMFVYIRIHLCIDVCTTSCPHFNLCVHLSMSRSSFTEHSNFAQVMMFKVLIFNWWITVIKSLPYMKKKEKSNFRNLYSIFTQENGKGCKENTESS